MGRGAGRCRLCQDMEDAIGKSIQPGCGSLPASHMAEEKDDAAVIASDHGKKVLWTDLGEIHFLSCRDGIASEEHASLFGDEAPEMVA